MTQFEEYNTVSIAVTSTLWHVNTDHLGSPTLLFNARDHSDQKEYSFSAWRVLRDPDDWTKPASTELYADRGYTGHEHLEEFSLINMNGRVYDSVLARFLSPDPCKCLLP
jgi:RHS repeat-associated protein